MPETESRTVSIQHLRLVFCRLINVDMLMWLKRTVAIGKEAVKLVTVETFTSYVVLGRIMDSFPFQVVPKLFGWEVTGEVLVSVFLLGDKN